MHISPPTASTLLSRYCSSGLLRKETYKNYIFYYANKESRDFIDISRIYWRAKLLDMLSYLEKKFTDTAIILFGSLSKAEVKNDSDIDLAIFSKKNDIDVEVFETSLKRKIQVFWFESKDDIKNKELASNVLNGYILRGRLQ